MDYFFWRIGDFFKRFFKGLFSGIVGAVVCALETARYLLYKVCMIILVFTNIGFIVGLVLLVLNIVEVYRGASFVDSRYFQPMIILLVSHIVLFSICRLLKPNDV